jgi:predicted AAA+ superfamily ATPase
MRRKHVAKKLMLKFKKTMFLNFEDTRLVNFLASDFTKLLEIIEQRDSNVLFFDEIQIVDGWEIFVR